MRNQREELRIKELTEWIAELDCTDDIMEILITNGYEAAWTELTNNYVGDSAIAQAMLEIIREA